MEVGQHAGPGLHFTFPVLPCQLLLPCLLEHGTKISIQGTVPAGASRFSVNLQRGIGTKEAPVVFHFNPRLLEGPVVVRNTRIEGVWGTEERSLDTAEFPFAHQKDFRMVITPDQKGYRVVVNEIPILTYEHRLPLEDVTHLCVKGDVMIRCLDVSIASPASKLLASIPNKHVRLGDIIIIKGQVPPDIERFTVNLQAGSSDEDDICLHINPRFDQGVIVRNTRINNSWGPEESSGGIPLTQGGSFVLVVAVLIECFKLWINGKYFSKYNHRCSLESNALVLVHGIHQPDIHIYSSPTFLCAQFGSATITPSQVRLEAIHPEMPSCFAVSGDLTTGCAFLVAAVPSEGAKRFAINLQTGESDTDDIAFHFNPRWDDGPSIVLNTRQSGSWGKEMVIPTFPFQIGCPFHLIIFCQDDGYALTLDDRLLVVYSHRVKCCFGEMRYFHGPLRYPKIYFNIFVNIFTIVTMT